MGRVPDMRKCSPSRYATVTPNGAVTYGFRCAFCNVPSLRFSTRALREERLKEHKKSAKKTALRLAKSSQS